MAKVSLSKKIPKVEGKNGVVVYSGGLDSAVVLAYLKTKLSGTVTGCFVQHEQRAPEAFYAEAFATAVGANLRTVHLEGLYGGRSLLSTPDAPLPNLPPGDEGQKATCVPNRDGIFTMIAIAEAIMVDADQVFTGLHTGLGFGLYPDSRPIYLERLASVAEVSHDDFEIRIQHPLVKLLKAEVIQLGASIGAPMEKTWSCYDRMMLDGAYIHCGVCRGCRGRRIGFRDAGVPDPTEYAETPDPEK